MSGDPHFMTFDCVKYEYHGQCEYTLVKTCSGGNVAGDGNDVIPFEVTGQMERLRYTPKVSVMRSVSIHIANTVRFFNKRRIFGLPNIPKDPY